MASIKTAVSLRKPLFDQINGLAGELNISRSRLFALAVEEFIKRHENQKLLDEINKAYNDAPSAEEATYQQKMRRKQRDLVEGQW